MVAYITGLAEPVYGREAHAAAMAQMLRIFPDMHVYSDPYPIQFGTGDWITVVTNATGTFTGELVMPDGTVIPRPERRSTSSSARPPSGTATSSSSSPPSGTPLCSGDRSGSPSPELAGRLAVGSRGPVADPLGPVAARAGRPQLTFTRSLVPTLFIGTSADFGHPLD
jgi:hypothetical protein